MATREAEASPFHALSVTDTLEAEHVEPRTGLPADEVAARRAAYGPNRMVEARKEPWRRAFARQYADPMQIVLLTGGMSAIAIILATELGLLQRVLHTVSLDLRQWIVCVAAGASIIVVSELRKLVLRRRPATATGQEGRR